MKILIHDLDRETFREIFSNIKKDDRIIIGPELRVHPCIDCYDCWIKMPGECPIQDDLGSLIQDLSTTEELVIVTRCFYGGPSPFVKMVLDRMRGYMMPFLDMGENVSYYRLRYRGRMRLKMIFYDTPEKEEKTAREYVERFSGGMGFSSAKVFFVKKNEGMGVAIDENRFD